MRCAGCPAKRTEQSQAHLPTPSPEPLFADAEIRENTAIDASGLHLPVRYFRRYPAGSMLGYAEEMLTLDPARTAFLVVDVYGETPNPIVVERIAPALQAARDAGLPVIYAGNSAPRIDLDHYEFTVQRNRNARHYFPEVSAELNGGSPRVSLRRWSMGTLPGLRGASRLVISLCARSPTADSTKHGWTAYCVIWVSRTWLRSAFQPANAC